MNQKIIDAFFNALFSIGADGENIKELIIERLQMTRFQRRHEKNKNWSKKINLYVFGVAHEDDGKIELMNGAYIGIPIRDIELSRVLFESGFKDIWEMDYFAKGDPDFITAKNCRIGNRTFWCHCFDLQKIIDRYFEPEAEKLVEVDYEVVDSESDPDPESPSPFEEEK